MVSEVTWIDNTAPNPKAVQWVDDVPPPLEGLSLAALPPKQKGVMDFVERLRSDPIEALRTYKDYRKPFLESYASIFNPTASIGDRFRSMVEVPYYAATLPVVMAEGLGIVGGAVIETTRAREGERVLPGPIPQSVEGFGRLSQFSQEVAKAIPKHYFQKYIQGAVGKGLQQLPDIGPLKNPLRENLKLRSDVETGWQSLKDYIWYQPEFFALDVLSVGTLALSALGKTGQLQPLLNKIPWSVRKPFTPPLAPSSPLGQAGVAPDIRQLRSVLPQKIALARGKELSKAAKVVKDITGYSDDVGLISSPYLTHNATSSSGFTKDGMKDIIAQQVGRGEAVSKVKGLAQNFVKTGLLDADDIKEAIAMGKIRAKVRINETQANKLFPEIKMEKAAQGEYWTRRYKLFEGDWKPSKADIDIVRDRFMSQGLNEIEIDGIIQNTLNKEGFPLLINKTVKFIPKQDALRYRMNIDPVIRKHLLGEINDPGYLVYSTLKEQKELLIKGKIYEKWADNPAIVAPEGLEAAPGFVKVVDKPWMGKLNNRLVRADLLEQLETSVSALNGWQKWWNEGMDAWRSSKTIFNVSGHARNVQWDMVLSAQLGIGPDDIASAAKSIHRRDAAYYTMLKHKVIGESFGKNEAALQFVDGLAGKGNWFSAVAKAGKSVKDVASGAWQYPDDVLKAAYWLKQRKAGMNVVDASLRARKHLPYYDEKAPITEFLRNTIMPFATFTAETLRTTLLNSAIDYPVSTVLLLNAPTMINEWQKKRLGISDQEWNKLTKMIPDYLADSGNYVLINKENGEYLLMNTTYSMGVTNVTASIPRPQRTLTENIQSMASHPALDAWTMLKTGKTSLGGEALNAYEKVLPDEASKAYARQLATLLLPSMTPGVGTLSQKVERNLREKKIAPGLMDWELGGVKLLVVDPKQAKRENLKEKKFDVADIKRAMTAVKNQVRSGKLSQERGRELILKLRDVYRKSKKISLIEPGAVEGEVS